MTTRKDNLSTRIGANMRRIRLEHGETQQELGESIGYGATTIANYESGYRLPDLVTVIDIAKHYGITLDELVLGGKTHES